MPAKALIPWVVMAECPDTQNLLYYLDLMTALPYDRHHHHDPRSPTLHYPRSLSELLAKWPTDDTQSLESLLPQVYDELRQLAHRYLRNQSPGHTLQSTALVHEAYLRLAN